MKQKPDKSCPMCPKKHYTKAQVIACMELDLKEAETKNRRLKPISHEQANLLLKR